MVEGFGSPRTTLFDAFFHPYCFDVGISMIVSVGVEGEGASSIEGVEDFCGGGDVLGGDVADAGSAGVVEGVLYVEAEDYVIVVIMALAVGSE